MLNAHTHQHMKEFRIFINGGSRDGELVYYTDDWEHPVILELNPPLVPASELRTEPDLEIADSHAPSGSVERDQDILPAAEIADPEQSEDEASDQNDSTQIDHNANVYILGAILAPSLLWGLSLAPNREKKASQRA